MKVFDRIKNFENKVNFVDENNVLLGYDLSQQCGEYADWFILKEIAKSQKHINEDEDKDLINKLDQYNFDPTFFKALEFDDRFRDPCSMAVFKIINKNDPEDILYIHLFNCHNGYYTHGFAFESSELQIYNGL